MPCERESIGALCPLQIVIPPPSTVSQPRTERKANQEALLLSHFLGSQSEQIPFESKSLSSIQTVAEERKKHISSILELK